MTDRELLELAAKAAGIPIYESVDGTIQNRPVLVFAAGGAMGTMPYEVRWNPLVDDAQALRLAVKLERFLDAGFWSKVFEARNGFDFGVDEFAATRRAIVRAAAEMKPTPLDWAALQGELE